MERLVNIIYVFNSVWNLLKDLDPCISVIGRGVGRAAWVGRWNQKGRNPMGRGNKGMKEGKWALGKIGKMEENRERKKETNEI